MARYFIEVPHEAERGACARAVKVFLSTGSHFLSNADWGCLDGEHKAWIIADLETRDQAVSIVPPALRANARVVKLNKFTMEQVDEILAQHGG